MYEEIIFIMNIGIIFFLIFLSIGFIVLISLYSLFTKDKLYFKFCYIALATFTIVFLNISYKDIYTNYTQKQKYISNLENPTYTTYHIKQYDIKIDYPSSFKCMDNKSQTDISFIDNKNNEQNYHVTVSKNVNNITLDKSCAELLNSYNLPIKYNKNSTKNDQYQRLYTTITGEKLNNHEYILYHEDKNTNRANYICVRVGERYICSFTITYDLKYADNYKGIIKHTYDSFTTPDLTHSSKN